MDMTGRSVGSDYKYGMNGQMKESAVSEGAYSAEFWTYDSRLGRRWEKDPLTYSWQSPSATFNNNPIMFADPRGLEGEPNGDHTYSTSETKTDNSEAFFKRGADDKPKQKNNCLIINESTSGSGNGWG